MKASDTFHQDPWRHNCAQAVAYAWKSQFPDSDPVPEFAAYGGGRAPDGCCGALYAAMRACPDKAGEIRSQFISRCGDFRCRHLKAAGRVPCSVCVDTADAILHSLLPFPQ